MIRATALPARTRPIFYMLMHLTLMRVKLVCSFRSSLAVLHSPFFILHIPQFALKATGESRTLHARVHFQLRSEGRERSKAALRISEVFRFSLGYTELVAAYMRRDCGESDVFRQPPMTYSLIFNILGCI